MKQILIISALIITIASCNKNGKLSDAYGNFEAKETIISAETSGKILQLNIEEGQLTRAGAKLGVIDTLQLHLKKTQAEAQRKAIMTKTANIFAQIDVANQEKQIILREKERVEKLLKDGAATTKQLDDINGKLDVVNSKINSIRTQNASVLAEVEAINAQIAQVDNMIQRSIITNPVQGTVLETYIEPNEIIGAGRPIYKIADISEMYLKAYVSGDQLPNIKVGQDVTVLIDKNKEENQSFTGKITWISSEAEFTPKIIQTKKERVNLVYAIKIKVKNEGAIKIGMPGEVRF